MKSTCSILTIAIVAMLPINLFAQTNTNQTSQTVPPIDPMIPYHAYNAAIDAGKFETAAEEGQKAWRAAEAKWGSRNSNTAALAYNAAWSAILLDRFNDALEPAKRATELAASNNGAYTLENAQFLKAYAEFSVAPESEKKHKVSELSDYAVTVAPRWEDFIVFVALNDAARVLNDAGKARKALELSKLNIENQERLGLKIAKIKALTLLHRGRANLALMNIKDSVSDLIEARIIYGAPIDYDDKTWGTLGAWHMAAIAVAKSRGLSEQRRNSETGELLTIRPFEYRTTSRSEWMGFSPREEKCRQFRIRRDERYGENVRFPSLQANQYIAAGVLVRLDISSSGEVINPRVIGAIPYAGFGESSLVSISTWRFQLAANTPIECRTGYLMNLMFSVKQN